MFHPGGNPPGRLFATFTVNQSYGDAKLVVVQELPFHWLPSGSGLGGDSGLPNDLTI
jgi:hypothetical protein